MFLMLETLLFLQCHGGIIQPDYLLSASAMQYQHWYYTLTAAAVYTTTFTAFYKIKQTSLAHHCVNNLVQEVNDLFLYWNIIYIQTRYLPELCSRYLL